MIDTKILFDFFKKEKIDFFSGVPDSVLKATSSYFSKKKSKNHFITANEGSAIAMGIGYNLATNKIPCIYMQNSGLGNAINPLISIANQKVYSIPLLLMIGWRGAPGTLDEPQHGVKGKITIDILKLLGIKYCILNRIEDFKKLKKIINFSKKNNAVVAFLIKKNILISKNKLTKKINFKSNIKRADIIENLLKNIRNNSKIVATTGFTSRELHQIRKNKKISRGEDFYMIGGMGHSSMVSLGITLRSKAQVICLDGDGSFLMHLGSIISIAKINKKNFKHILLNNYSHESVGGQTTNIEKVNIKNLIKAAGYRNYFKISNKKNINNIMKSFLNSKGPSFLEIKIDNGSIENLKRPKDFLSLKKKFQRSF